IPEKNPDVPSLATACYGRPFDACTCRNEKGMPLVEACPVFPCDGGAQRPLAVTLQVRLKVASASLAKLASAIPVEVSISGLSGPAGHPLPAQVKVAPLPVLQSRPASGMSRTRAPSAASGPAFFT